MKKFSRLLKNSDIFGSMIGFKFEGEDRIKSFLGGCLTISLMLTGIIIVIITFENWGINNFNLSIKTSTFDKDLTNPDSFNSSFFGYTEENKGIIFV